MTLPDHFGLLVLAGCVVIAFALAAAGVIRLVREGAALKRRVEAYADLPLRADVQLASRRVALAERRAGSLSSLADSAQRSFAEIDAARRSVGTQARDLFLLFWYPARR